MKKTTLSILAITAISLFSCSKDDAGIITQSKTPGKEITSVQIVSEWLTMDFVPGEKYNAQGLEATHYFNPSTLYNEQETTKMAFVRTGESYTALPANVEIDDATMRLSFLLTYGSFTVMANNADEQGVPDASKLANVQFRYIVVSNSLINSTDIDWTDYSAVARALNIEN
jgi:hypothetical protein